MIPSAERNRSSIQIATLLSSPVFGAFVSGEAIGAGVTVAAVDAVVAEGAVVGVTEGIYSRYFYFVFVFIFFQYTLFQVKGL